MSSRLIHPSRQINSVYGGQEGSLGSKHKFSSGENTEAIPRMELHSEKTERAHSLLRCGVLKMPADKPIQSGNFRGKKHQDVSPPPVQKCGVWVLSQLLAKLKKHLQRRGGPDGTVQFQQQQMKAWRVKSTSSFQECPALGAPTFSPWSTMPLPVSLLWFAWSVVPLALPISYANHRCELVSTVSIPSLSLSIHRVSGPGPVHPFCSMGLPSPYQILLPGGAEFFSP